MNQLTRITEKGKLSFGIVFPLESYKGSIPEMKNQEQLAQLAEEVGFQSLWFRDVPFHDPSFGDAGQMYDPWIYMTHIMNHTKHMALATGSVILPLRHPVHTAKSINSIQSLSNGRLILGIASGDRPLEYPAFGQDLAQRAELFRDSFFYTKALLGDFPNYQSSHYGAVGGAIDILPKYDGSSPMLVTGHSGQDLNWIAEFADGWLYYPRAFHFMKFILEDWQKALDYKKQPWKPYLQSLYLDILDDPDAAPRPIHLGFQSGIHYAIEHLKTLEAMGVSHVVFNLKFASRPVKEVIQQIGEDIFSVF